MINTRRLLHQIKLNFILRWKMYAIIVGTGLFILIFQFFNKDFSLVDFATSRISSTTFFNNNVTPDVHKFHFKWFPNFLFIISGIITSLSFSEYGDNRSRTFHLSIPSSVFEKWLSKVIIAMLIVPLCLVLIYQVFIWVSHLWPPVDEYYQVPVNVLDPYLRPHIIRSILLQGLVILFAIWYKKFSLGKAILTGIGIVFLYNLVVIISLALFNNNNKLTEDMSAQSLTSIQDFVYGSGFITSERGYSFTQTFLGDNWTLSMTALVCLVISFLRYKEMQA